MLKNPDDVSETLFHVLDKVCTTIVKENSSQDGRLTVQNLL